MKRKLPKFIYLLISTLSLTACDFSFIFGEDEEHEHHFGSWEIVTNATCTTDGLKERHCTDCDEIETQKIDKTGHNLTNWDVKTPATCTEAGVEERHCINCDYEEERNINPNGHVYGEWIVSLKPTVDLQGSKYRECSVCHHVETVSIPRLKGGYDYNGYYANLVSWTDSEDLVNQLNTIISGGTYNPISYADPTNWETNAYADQAIDDFESVDIMYSEKNNLKTFTAGSSTLGWNREHCFCASLMTGSNTGDAVKFLGRATDFQNLIAAGQAGNQSRGNKNYGYANAQATGYTNNTTKNGLDGYSYDSKNFEPGDIDKGRAARAILYMPIMYNKTVVDTRNNKTMKALSVVEEYVNYNSTTYDAYAHGNLNDLMEWALNYPVDRLEYQHNESIYSHVYSPSNHAQGNRNPLVDYPELVEYIYGSKKNEGGTLSSLTASYYTLEIDDSTTVANYAIKTAKREYEVGETFTPNDYEIVKVYKDFHNEVVTDGFSSENYTFTESDAGKTIELVINTPINTIKYDVSVSVRDEAKTCNYVAVMSEYSSTFTALKDTAAQVNTNQAIHSDVDNEITLNGVQWLAKWTHSYINGFNAEDGLQIGSSNYSPKPVTFKTKDDFCYQGKINISKIYLKADTASDKSGGDSKVPLTIKVGNTVVLTTYIKYQSSGCGTYGVTLSAPLSGQISIEFGESAKKCALYIHTIAILVN